MKYRSGLLAALLSIAIAAPVFAQDDSAAAAPAADAPADASAAPADTSAAPADAAPADAAPADAAPADASAAPADDSAAAPADSSAAPADASAAPADASTDSTAAPADASAAPADASATPEDTSAAPADASTDSTTSTDTSAAPADATATDTSAAATDTGASEMSSDSASAESSEPAEPAGPAIKGHPFYISPMFSYTLTDGDRATKNGIGGVMSIGKRLTNGLNLELNTFYTTMKGDSQAKAGGFSGDAKLKGVGLTAMVFPLSVLPNAFGIVSVDYATGENAPYGQPLYASSPTSVPSLDYRSTVFDLGVGYLFPITQRILLRAEARYRMDSHGREYLGIHSGERSAFYEGVFNVGLLIPLGSKSAPPPPPPAAPVDVVAAPEAAPAPPVCPNKPADMPEDAPVGPDGCPLDTDGDGVPDYLDECPHTPAGAKVLANGCALKDDCRTPKAGEAVDENGCAVNKAFILKGVNFEFDSDRLTPDAKEILNGVAETLKSYSDLKIEVAGHTDDVGSEGYNMGLSERRANSVKTYLGSRGVDTSRLTPVGYGKTKPLVEGTTDEDRAKNRRVELNVKD